mmetsp:Transcript_1342/g.850  ORF Transcript_1342/g.850 Transcript_1342/m.850 type:complete len:97 (-) Transcript_1342:1647-1937(-)
MFGTSAMFLFKFPLLKRKLNRIKAGIREANENSLEESEVDELAKEAIIKEDLIDMNSECKEDEDEEEVRKQLVRVEDYSKVEIEEDMNTIDWEIAY